MKNLEDLLSSARTVHARYQAGRMERETVREWVLGLSEYPPPHGPRVREAAEWFKPLRSETEAEELKPVDLDTLQAIFLPGA